MLTKMWNWFRNLDRDEFREQLDPGRLVGEQIICRFPHPSYPRTGAYYSWEDLTVEEISSSGVHLVLRNNLTGEKRVMTTKGFRETVCFTTGFMPGYVTDLLRKTGKLR